jgi:hypothetical protein
MAMAGRSDDLTKMVGKSLPHLRIQESPGGITFIPRKLRMKDRPGHLLEDIFVPKFEDRKLDPVRAVKLDFKGLGEEERALRASS